VLILLPVVVVGRPERHEPRPAPFEPRLGARILASGIRPDVLQLLVTVGPHRQLQPEARRNGVVDSQTQLVTLHNGSSADRPDAAHQVDEELVALTRPAPPEAAHEAALALAAVSLGLLATEAHVGARG